MSGNRSHRSRGALAALTALVAISMASTGVASSREVITGDLSNSYYRKAHSPLAHVRIEDVKDLRGLADAEALTMSEVRGSSEKGRSCFLAEPVAGFVKRSFESVLGSDVPSKRAVRVELGIEVLDLRYRKKFLGWLVGENGCATFEGRFRVTALTDSGRVEAGWIQTTNKVDVELWKVGSAISESFHKGLATLALGLAQGKVRLPSTEVASDGTDATPATHQTAEVEWGAVRAAQTNTWRLGGVGFSYQGLTSSSMKDVYGNLVCLRGDLLVVPDRGRLGYYAGLGYLLGSGTAAVRPGGPSDLSADIDLKGAGLDGGVLLRLPLGRTSARWRLFTRVGLGLFGAEERTQVAVPPDLAPLVGLRERFEVTEFVASFQAHAALGTAVRVASETFGLAEIRWAQSGPSGRGPSTGAQNEIAERDFALSSLGMPNNDLTSWQIYLGLMGKW